MIFKDQLVKHTERIFDGKNPATSVTIHDTDNQDVGANAQAHANLQSGNNVRQASWHEQVDDTQSIRSYKSSAQCWHAGDGKNGPGNTTSYAIELCINADGDLAQAIENLVRVTIRRLDELGLTVADIVDHSHWSSKQCPRVFRDNPGSWVRFLHAVKTRDPEYTVLQGDPMSKFSSPVPVGCRFTSGFGNRWGTLHAGTDWAPPRPGQTGIPIYAIHDGPIIAVGTGNGRSNSRIPYHSGKYIWQDLGVHGGDRMRAYYGHLASYSVRAGQKVKAGQQIGIMGATGNVTGIHLHLGISVNHNRPTVRWNARTNAGWTDPARWLASKGITPGRTRPAISSSNSSSGSSSSGSSSSSSGQYTRRATNRNNVPVYANRGPNKRRVGTASKKGYRLNVVKTEGSWTQVRWDYGGKYQNAWVATAHLEGGGSSSGSSGIEWPANKLRVDGDWGPVTRRAYQRLLAPSSVGNYKGTIDGNVGPVTVRAEQRWLANRGHYKGRIDGQRGQMTIRALQNRLKADGFYKGRVDGQFGPVSVRALQSLMNDQRNLYN